MTHNPHHTTRRWLAPITPEVVVAVSPHGLSRIVDISPRAAAWTGSPPERLIGRPVSEVFDGMLPGLSIVVEDVCSSGTAVRDYRLSFEDATGRQRTVYVNASLKPKTVGLDEQIVAVRMEEAPNRRRPVSLESEAQSFHGMVGRSPALLGVFRKIEIYGPTDAPVLITGETGTGKELAARAIHDCSRRRDNSFLAVNCSTLTGELLESELFGHEKGAFTGAHRLHRGRFERAHGGTLFLDEVGEMPLSAQAKLLRVLEENQIERVGGERMIAVDVRLVTATNVPLEWAIQTKSFRLDLYHRLEVLRLRMPPLRERTEDIPLLVTYFLEQFDKKYQRHVHRLTPEAITLLQGYTWPGNIRELRNVLERIYVETSTDVIGRKAFEEWVRERAEFLPAGWDLQARQDALVSRPVLVTPYHRGTPVSRPLLPDLRRVETPIDLERTTMTGMGPERWTYVGQSEQATPRGARELTRTRIEAAYRRAQGNMTQAARYLGVHKATLYRRLKTLGLTREELDAAAASNSGH